MSVSVHHEQADQRRHLWISTPFAVEIAGKRQWATAWSLAGVAIRRGSQPALTPGHRVSLRLTLPFQGFEISFATTGVVEEADPTEGLPTDGSPSETLIVRFDALTERDRELLEHFIEDLVSGRAVAVGDTLMRLDVARPRSSPVAGSAPARRPFRALVMAALYAGLGFAVFGYLATIVYTNYTWQEIPIAAMTADIEPVRALADGHVISAGLKPGARVKAGEVVAHIVDMRLERDIRISEINVREREARWRAAILVPPRGNRIEIQAQAKADIQAAMDKRQTLINQRVELAVRAPFDGILTAFPHADHVTVRRGDTVALFERGARNEVTAFLTTAELDRVRVGSRAIVRFPGSSQTVEAQVSEVVPYGPLTYHISGRDMTDRFALPRPADRPVTVKLALVAPATGDGVITAQPGQPVMVVLERHSVRRAIEQTEGALERARALWASVRERLTRSVSAPPDDQRAPMPRQQDGKTTTAHASETRP